VPVAHVLVGLVEVGHILRDHVAGGDVSAAAEPPLAGDAVPLLGLKVPGGWGRRGWEREVGGERGRKGIQGEQACILSVVCAAGMYVACDNMCGVLDTWKFVCFCMGCSNSVGMNLEDGQSGVHCT
jgi:hypothetical protein